MFIEIFDDDQPAVVWLFAGRTNADGDHARWLSAITRLDGVGRGRDGGSMLIIDDGNPPPPANMRSEIARVARAVTDESPLAVVTSSMIARAIIAGLNAGGVVGFTIKGFGDVADAVAWLAGRCRGVQSATLLAMVDEARHKAARASATPR